MGKHGFPENSKTNIQTILSAAPANAAALTPPAASAQPPAAKKTVVPRFLNFMMKSADQPVEKQPEEKPEEKKVEEKSVEEEKPQFGSLTQAGEWDDLFKTFEV